MDILCRRIHCGVGARSRRTRDADESRDPRRDIDRVRDIGDDARDPLLIVGGSGVGCSDASVAALTACGKVVAHGLALHPGRTAAVGKIGATPMIVVPGAPSQALAAWLALARPALPAGGRSRFAALSDGNDKFPERKRHPQPPHRRQYGHIQLSAGFSRGGLH